MKILLIGEFSALHKNLKEGLENLGHDVDIAAMGDGWKNISRDIDLGSKYNGVLGALERRINVFRKLSNLSDYDVVQIINPFCLFYIPFFTKRLIKKIIKNNKKIFLSASGTDSFYLLNADKKMNYSPVGDFLRYDYKKNKHQYLKKSYVKFNRWLAENVNGIIPIMYEYDICYKDTYRTAPCIAIPMNIKKITYKPNVVKDKIIIFHGLNRYGFKGTKYIEEAFNRLKDKYIDTVDFIIQGNMPLSDYLDLMDKTHIVVDQTSSYSSGVNAIYALAMGKIVLGGAEPEGLKSLCMNSNPVINIKPNVDDICEQLEKLIANKDKFELKGNESRLFVEKYHDSIVVAKKYVSTWQHY